MKIGFALKHHDHAYVERRGGFLLLTYMRGVQGRADYRRDALDRALAAYDERTSSEACAAGLVVLQRALLCAEDLGRLLYALAGPDAWTRLRSAKLGELDETFVTITSDGGQFRREAFRLPTPTVMAEEGWDVADQAALHRLCALVDSRRMRMLSAVAGLWLSHSRVAKATMHGLPVLAGKYIVEPPGAGSIGNGIVDPGVPFSVVLSTTARDTAVHTDLQTLAMDRSSVAAWRRDGVMATRVARDLCDAQAGSIMGGYGVIVPTDLVARLSVEDQGRIEHLVAVREEEDERAAT